MTHHSGQERAEDQAKERHIKPFLLGVLRVLRGSKCFRFFESLKAPPATEIEVLWGMGIEISWPTS